MQLWHLNSLVWRKLKVSAPSLPSNIKSKSPRVWSLNWHSRFCSLSRDHVILVFFFAIFLTNLISLLWSPFCSFLAVLMQFCPHHYEVYWFKFLSWLAVTRADGWWRLFSISEGGGTHHTGCSRHVSRVWWCPEWRKESVHRNVQVWQKNIANRLNETAV